MQPDRLTQLQAFLQQNPTDPFLHYALALEYLKKEEYQFALEAFITLVGVSPTYVGTYYHLGKLYEKLNNFALALIAYSDGMEIAQQLNDSHSYNELRGAYQMLHDEIEGY